MTDERADLMTTDDTDNPRLQASKAMFLSCLIDDRVGQIINPLLAEFKAKGWPDSYYSVFFTRLADAARLEAARKDVGA